MSQPVTPLPYSWHFPGSTADNNSDITITGALPAPGTGWTMELWMYPEENPIIAAIGLYGGINNPRLTWGDAGGTSPVVNFFVANSNESLGGDSVSTANLSLNTWHHVAGVVTGVGSDAPAIAIYHNSTLVSSKQLSFPVKTPDRIGTWFVNRRDNNRKFKGAICEIRYWTQALTQAEIQDHYVTPLEGNETGLGVYYRGHEKTGLILYDFFAQRNGTAAGDVTHVNSNPLVPSYEVRLYVSSDFTTNNSDQIITEYCERINISRSIINMFNPLRVNEMTITLNNPDGTYSRNVNSLMVTGTNIGANVTYASSTYPLFYGVIQRLSENRIQRGSIITITAHDLLYQTRKTRSATSSLYTNQSLPSEIGNLIDNSPGMTLINSVRADASSTVIHLPWIPVTERAADTINELIIAHNVWFWNTASNALVAEPFSYAVVGTPVASYDSFATLSIGDNAEEIINRLELIATPRIKSETTSITWMDNPAYVPPDSTIQINLHYYDPVTFERTLPGQRTGGFSNGTNWTTNTKSDGSGSSMAGNTTISFIDDSHTSANANITNTHASQGMFVTKFVVSGFVYRSRGTLNIIEVDSQSQVDHGVRQKTVSNRYWTDVVDTKSFAAYVVSNYKDPRPIINATIRNHFPDVLVRMTGDLVTIVDSFSGTDGMYIITELEHDFSGRRGIEHTIRITGEKFAP